MKRSQGYRASTRQLFRKNPRKRGLLPLGRLLKKYELGDKVIIDIEPSIAKGQPHRRYHGKQGSIMEKRGRAYVVSIIDGSKPRKIISFPDHLRSA